MAWDPTGRKLATCLGNPPRIEIRDVDTGGLILALDDQVPFLRGLSWSPDGDRLGYLVGDRWRVRDLAVGRLLPTGAADGQLLAWRPDGGRFALIGKGDYGRGVAGVFDSSTGAAVAGDAGFAAPDPAAMNLPPGQAEISNLQVQSVTWGGDGIRAAGNAMRYPGVGMIVCWDVRTGKPLLQLGRPDGPNPDRGRVARLVAWAPDGGSWPRSRGSRTATARSTSGMLRPARRPGHSAAASSISGAPSPSPGARTASGWPARPIPSRSGTRSSRCSPHLAGGSEARVRHEPDIPGLERRRPQPGRTRLPPFAGPRGQLDCMGRDHRPATLRPDPPL